MSAIRPGMTKQCWVARTRRSARLVWEDVYEPRQKMSPLAQLQQSQYCLAAILLLPACSIHPNKDLTVTRPICGELEHGVIGISTVVVYR